MTNETTREARRETNGTSTMKRDHRVVQRELPMQKEMPWSEWVDISPEVAKEWFDKHKNPNNRTANVPRIDAMAQDIVDGAYDVTHQGIAFTSDGKDRQISDGHHRLLAIHRSGKTVRMLVTYGIPHSAIIDQGWTRSIAAARKMRGENTDRSHHSYVGIVRSLLKLEANNMFMFVSEKQIREAEDRHASSLCWMLEIYSRKMPASAWAALCFAHPFLPQAVDELAMATIGSGAALVAGSASLSYRNMILTADTAGATNTIAVMHKTFTAVRAHASGRKVSRLGVNTDDYQWFRTQWETSR